MKALAMDRGIQGFWFFKDSENAPNSFLPKINRTGFWLFGAEMYFSHPVAWAKYFYPWTHQYCLWKVFCYAHLIAPECLRRFAPGKLINVKLKMAWIKT